ncbi:MAG: glycosyltransferase [Anaerolineales bacterium]|jgi:glycosyltransferase involved in cell wall biosynthesis
MHIGMMADAYKPYVSGITNYIDLNKHYLEKAGHEVYVFTFSEPDHQDDEPRVIRSPGLPLADTGFFLSLKYSREAKKLLQSMDIVHVHHPFLSGRLALHYCRPARLPIVFTNHTRYDLYAQAYFPLLPEEISEGLLRAYMPSFCEAVNLVISPSPGMEKILRELDVEIPIEIVPNGVELARFIQAEPLSRAEYSFSEDDILLIYTGRLGPEKNLDFLLQAFAGVVQAVENVRLLLVGDGPIKVELQTLASNLQIIEFVQFAGQIPYDKMPGYLAMCDVFVTASVSEVHPLSVIEAMGAGLPVMGIYSPGVGDSVEDGITGLLSTRNLPAFTAKLTRMCLQSQHRKKMGQMARKVSQKYDIELTTQMMTGHYEKLANEPRHHKLDWDERLLNILERFRV